MEAAKPAQISRNYAIGGEVMIDEEQLLVIELKHDWSGCVADAADGLSQRIV